MITNFPVYSDPMKFITVFT